MPQSNSPRQPKPLDPASLESLALFYVGRFATTRARLVDYLRRKVRERGWASADAPPLDAIADRCVDARYVDDAAFAASRSAGLLRRGYGKRRIQQSLTAAGVARDLVAEVAPDEEAALAAAEALARRRRFGIYGSAPLDQAQRRRQFAAMMRAGHDHDTARRFIRDPDRDNDAPDS